MKKKSGILALSGLGLTALGLWMALSQGEKPGWPPALPYLLLGLGCGVFGHGTGSWISGKILEGDPQIERRARIETADERNQMIGNRAKAKAFDLMLYLFAGVLLVFALMGVDTVAVLLLTGAYLVCLGWGLYWRFRYEKEM